MPNPTTDTKARDPGAPWAKLQERLGDDSWVDIAIFHDEHLERWAFLVADPEPPQHAFFVAVKSKSGVSSTLMVRADVRGAQLLHGRVHRGYRGSWEKIRDRLENPRVYGYSGGRQRSDGDRVFPKHRAKEDAA